MSLSVPLFVEVWSLAYGDHSSAGGAATPTASAVGPSGGALLAGGGAELRLETRSSWTSRTESSRYSSRVLYVDQHPRDV